MNFGASVDVWYASGPRIPTTFDLEESETLWYAKQDSETTPTFLKMAESHKTWCYSICFLNLWGCVQMCSIIWSLYSTNFQCIKNKSCIIRFCEVPLFSKRLYLSGSSPVSCHNNACDFNTRTTLVKRVPQLRFEPVSFLSIVYVCENFFVVKILTYHTLRNMTLNVLSIRRVRKNP